MAVHSLFTALSDQTQPSLSQAGKSLSLVGRVLSIYNIYRLQCTDNHSNLDCKIGPTQVTSNIDLSRSASLPASWA